MTQPTPQPQSAPTANRDIVVGATVYGVDNARFGQVAGSYRNYLIVERGFFMPIDYYVPMNAIGRVDDDLVVLSVSRDAALTQGWERPPFTSETGQRGLRRPAVGRASAAGSVGATVASAAGRPATQPAAPTEPVAGWPSLQTTDAATGASNGPPAAAVVATGVEPVPAETATGPNESHPASAAPAARSLGARPGGAAAPVTGPFADTYAVGTNTDSYQAMTDFLPGDAVSAPEPESVATATSADEAGSEPQAPDASPGDGSTTDQPEAPRQRP